MSSFDERARELVTAFHARGVSQLYDTDASNALSRSIEPLIAELTDAAVRRIERDAGVAAAQVDAIGPSTVVTLGARVAAANAEWRAIHRRLAEMGVEIVLNRGVTEIAAGHVVSNCTYTDQTRQIDCDAVVVVASKLENNQLYHDLKAREAAWADAGINSVRIIGDAEAPGPIAWATYAGHRYARELDGEDTGDALPFRREITELAVD